MTINLEGTLRKGVQWIALNFGSAEVLAKINVKTNLLIPLKEIGEQV